MQEQVVMASELKKQLLMLLDQVARTKVPVLVTKRGRPVARLAPVEGASRRSIMGSLRLVAKEDEAYLSTGEAWEAEGLAPEA